MGHSEWKEADHGPLIQVSKDLFVVEAQLERMPFERRMTIIRHAEGQLLIHSAIACRESLMQEIEALGDVRCIVVPGPQHRMDAPAYAERYPNARVLTPQAAKGAVERVVSVDGDYSEIHHPGSAGASGIRAEVLDGVEVEGVLIYTAPNGERTLIFNDALMNLPHNIPGIQGWIVKLLGSTGGPKVTRMARWFFVDDAAAYKAHLLRLADTEGLTRIIVGHGEFIEKAPAEVLREVAETL